MEKSEFREKYSKQLNLDNKVWDLPSKAVVGFKSQIHPFHVQVSLKQEIDCDYLYYFVRNNLYELNVANNLNVFLDEKNRNSSGIELIERGKLKALKIPSIYLRKIETFDNTNDINFFNKVEFPIKDVNVKPINDYLDDKQVYNLSFEPIKDSVEIKDYSKDDFTVDGKQIIFKDLPDNYLVTYTKPIDIEKDKPYIPVEVNVKPSLSNFDLTINNRLDYVKGLLLVKAKEYVRNNNRFHSFDRGSALTGECREKVLWGFLLKHIISIQDMINDINETGDLPSKELVSEKAGDAISYLLLLEASINDKRDK
jgi:hypothetical protein